MHMAQWVAVFKRTARKSNLPKTKELPVGEAKNAGDAREKALKLGKGAFAGYSYHRVRKA
jgi:hypothetical protein